ncbi:hypothetical protein N0V90_012590 [Kalmusia sp. IMI 367209]|nr:hypothetical protein N0V90_012590 [Kalmusia sp. IMI 367209]
MATPPTIHALIFSKTAGYRHASIPAGIAAITKLLVQTGPFHVSASEDAETIFTTSRLSQFHVVILLQTSGNFLTSGQLSALQEYMRSGGGVFAIHGAAAGMLSSAWYGKLIGAHFDRHPDPEPGSMLVSDASHPIIASQDPPEKWMDEWYNFTSHPAQNKHLKILLRGNTKSFKGGNHGDDHPLAWCQEFDGGRSAYIALGHFDEAYGDEWFMGIVRRGILWVAGREGSGL